MATLYPRTSLDTEARREIKLSRRDHIAVQDADTSKASRKVPGEWVKVLDDISGQYIECRISPCGLGCKCDMQWREVSHADPVRPGAAHAS